jgi:hypothetical protein
MEPLGFTLRASAVSETASVARALSEACHFRARGMLWLVALLLAFPAAAMAQPGTLLVATFNDVHSFSLIGGRAVRTPIMSTALSNVPSPH